MQSRREEGGKGRRGRPYEEERDREKKKKINVLNIYRNNRIRKTNP